MEVKFFELLFGGLFSAIIIMIVKGFFTNIEKRIEKIETTLELKVNSLNRQIDELNNKYGEIFNQLLVKFSNWEDRIKSIMDEIVKREISGGVRDASEYLEVVMKDFDKNTTRDIELIKKEIDALEVDLKTLEKETVVNHKDLKLSSQDFIIATKKILRKLNDDLNNLKFNMQSGFGSQNEKIKALYTVCTAINNDHKLLAEKIRVFIKDHNNRVVFTDTKKK